MQIYDKFPLHSFCSNYGEKQSIWARNKQKAASCRESRHLSRQVVKSQQDQLLTCRDKDPLAATTRGKFGHQLLTCYNKDPFTATTGGKFGHSIIDLSRQEAISQDNLRTSSDICLTQTCHFWPFSFWLISRDTIYISLLVVLRVRISRENTALGFLPS